MNQILDIIGSYAIGGLVLLMILGMVYFFNSRQQDTMFSQMDQNSIMEIGNIIEDDFTKIGYGMVSSDGDKYLSTDSTSIVFRGDLDNNGIIDTVSYSLVKNNSKEYLQRRDYNGKVTEWRYPVQNFRLYYYTKKGQPATDRLNVYSILVKVETANNSTDNGSSQNPVGAAWQREFFPENCNKDF